MKTCPTRRSLFLFLLCVLVFFGIVGTHNNLLYLVLSMFLTCMAIGWAGPAVFCRHLRIERNVPETAHAGTELTVVVRLHNPHRLFPVPPIIVHNAARFSSDSDRPVLVGGLAPKSEVRFSRPLLLSRRGRWTLEEIRLECAFPMGLFQREWTLGGSADILVYPRIVQVRDRLLEGMTVNLSKMSSIPDTEREVRNLRFYRDGDDIRRINWKATARRDTLVVGEYHRVEKRPRVALYLDISSGRESSREKAISMIASLAVFYHSRKRLIKLMTPEKTITFGRSERKIRSMLAHLALLDTSTRNPLTHIPRESVSCFRVLVSSGLRPRSHHGFDLVLTPANFKNYAPALGKRKNGE